jgi:hypothetical protein
LPAIAEISEAASVTVWLWPADPEMLRAIPPPAESCADVIIAEWPWFALMEPVLSPPDDVGAAGEGDELLPQPETVIATPLKIAIAAANVNSRRPSIRASFMVSSSSADVPG